MDSSVVEVAIGVLVVFLVFSLVVSGMHEAVARVLSWRAKALWAGVHRLIDPPSTPVLKTGNRLIHVASEGDVRPAETDPADLTGALYAHPLIGGLEQLGDKAKTRIDRIEPSSFARALIDVLVPDGDGTTSVDQVRARVSALPAGHPLRRQLLILVSEADANLDTLRVKVEGWFDAQMDALSAAYRKRSKWFMLGFGMFVAFALNVNAITLAETFYRDDALRTSVVALAEGVGQACNGQTGDDLTSCLRTETTPLQEAVELPIGWDGLDLTATGIAGRLLAGFALMQGAPFWFRLLQRASSLRRSREPAPAA